jgi:succinoglycan biosynthesis transport protein ExoP
MTDSSHTIRALTLTDYLAVLRRRLLVIVGAAVLAAGTATFLSLSLPDKYSASSEVYVSRQNLGLSITGTTNPDLYSDPIRVLQTQADIARSPQVTAVAARRAKVPGVNGGTLLASSGVSPKSNADLLRFSVTNGDPAAAARLANAYAQAFAAYRVQLDTSALTKALSQVGAQITQLRRRGDQESDLYKGLVSSAQQLRTIEILQPHYPVTRSATLGTQVAPTPKRNGIIGGMFGLILGFGIAFLWEALDKRIRSEDEIQERLGLPLLSRLPAPPRALRSDNRLTMLHDPGDIHAEAIRRLRVNLEFASLDRDVTTILITSAVQQEGKSTTIADLAVAQARAGRNVALVDLDLRRPAIATFFGLPGRVGVTDVALGRAAIWQAIKPVEIDYSVAAASNRNGANVSAASAGKLSVLPAGLLPPNPGEFVGTQALARVLEELRLKFDTVLIDAPPICIVGDALTISAHVDALFVVARVGSADRQMLGDLVRELDASPAPKLGFALTGVERKDGYGYASYAHYTQPVEPAASVPEQRRPTASR